MDRCAPGRLGQTSPISFPTVHARRIGCLEREAICRPAFLGIPRAAIDPGQAASAHRAAARRRSSRLAPALVGVVRCVADQPGACTNGEALVYRLAFQLSAAAAIAAVLALTLADVAGGEVQLAEFGVLAVGALALGDLRRRLPSQPCGPPPPPPPSSAR
jgi:hypothetical protein